MIICSHESITQSQPPLCVGYAYPVYDKDGNDLGGCRLSVHRTYPLPNEWGGIGRIKHLDGDGKIFPSYQEAREWAIQHGYLRTWFRPYNPTKKLDRARVYKLLSRQSTC
jgi:hypothetical protein